MTERQRYYESLIEEILEAYLQFEQRRAGRSV